MIGLPKGTQREEGTSTMNDKFPKPINVKDDVWEFVTKDIGESLRDYAVMLQCIDDQTAKSILVLRRTKYKERK